MECLCCGNTGHVKVVCYKRNRNKCKKDAENDVVTKAMVASTTRQQNKPPRDLALTWSRSAHIDSSTISHMMQEKYISTSSGIQSIATIATAEKHVQDEDLSLVYSEVVWSADVAKAEPSATFTRD